MPANYLPVLLLVIVLPYERTNMVSAIEAKCSACKAVAERIEMALDEEKPHQDLDLRGRLDSQGVRFGKVVDYKMSELRMVELFDDLCESMSKYGLATEDGTPVWVLKAGKKGLATGAKGKAETKDLTSYCGALLEESEESLMEAIQSDELEHTKVADILCKQITHHCKEPKKPKKSKKKTEL
ncbi:hypothetical protein CYMTET_12596 [Cymbomonas tetramitiformis]|uniref:DUF3456 domain-containing protein n=1 Tax=Cymbomonas tetramitiformis TaxID=36881 RepID=A0AAE0GJQ5_9CHLO|nr:hypothetical protein CYMTET_12596 [Cymbomonas tetramitiformis]